MAATKASCCSVQITGRGDITCDAEPEFGFSDGGISPFHVNYACADHLGHVIGDEAKRVSVWPLVDGGYDPTIYSADDIAAARAQLTTTKGA